MIRLLPALFALMLTTGCPLPEDEKDTAADTGEGDSGDTDTPAPLLPAGFEAMLDTTGGCSDTTMHAWDGDGTVGLRVYRAGILAAVTASGEPVTETLFVGVDDVDVSVEIADPVAINYCTDALSARTVFEQWAAVSGTVILHMDVPASEWADGVLDVQVMDLVLHDDAGHTATVAEASFMDVSIMRVWGG
ncbi:MAG: hypothetical protein V4850_07275 [Myxococcota bacterium]